jgi:hypothetical protein
MAIMTSRVELAGCAHRVEPECTIEKRFVIVRSRSAGALKQK